MVVNRQSNVFSGDDQKLGYCHQKSYEIAQSDILTQLYFLIMYTGHLELVVLTRQFYLHNCKRIVFGFFLSFCEKKHKCCACVCAFVLDNATNILSLVQS